MPSATQKKEEHIHKFKGHLYKSGSKIFFCTLPKCNKKIKSALALGKETLCWRCEEPFILTEYALRLIKPHCEKCHKSKNLRPPSLITVGEYISQDENQELRIMTKEPISLTERLRKATGQVNHVKINMTGEEEDDEL